MFGYVRARTDLLSAEDSASYRAAYCGLCRDLGRRYGFFCRFLVNYDMTFLYLTLNSAAPAGKTRRCWCPARICGRKTCFCDPESFRSVSARTVILTWQKLDDNVRDCGFLLSLPYRFLRLFFRRAYRKACADAPSFAQLAELQLKKLSELETAKSDSIDATADAFAKIVSACADELEEEASHRAAQVLLYQVGRFIYLTDALDDLEEDFRKDRYNPLRYRFSVSDGRLSPQDRAYLTELTDSSVNLAGAALALIRQRSFGTLLENIVYLGLPTVFAAVKNGTFRSHAKDKPRKEHDT